MTARLNPVSEFLIMKGDSECKCVIGLCVVQCNAWQAP